MPARLCLPAKELADRQFLGMVPPLLFRLRDIACGFFGGFFGWHLSRHGETPKVVEHGKADGMYVTTAGLGRVDPRARLSPREVL